MTSSLTRPATFTRTDARYVGSKVAADLRGLNTVYGAPALGDIDDYADEVALLLKAGYLQTVDYGFKDTSGWKLRLRYTATAGGQLQDDNPGRLPRGAAVVGVPFYSYLTYSQAYQRLGPDARKAFDATLPFRRTGAAEPALGRGRAGVAASYARNGQGVGREVWSAAP